MWKFFVSCSWGLESGSKRPESFARQWCAGSENRFSAERVCLECTFRASRPKWISDSTFDKHKLENRLSILNSVEPADAEKTFLCEASKTEEKIERFHIIGLLVVSSEKKASQQKIKQAKSITACIKMFYARLDIHRCVVSSAGLCICVSSYSVNRLLNLLALQVDVEGLCGSASDGSLWTKDTLEAQHREEEHRKTTKNEKLSKTSSSLFVWIGNYVYFYAQNALMQCILLFSLPFFPRFFQTHSLHTSTENFCTKKTFLFRVLSFVCTTEWIVVISLMKMLDGK